MEGNKNGNHTVNNEDEDGSVAKQEDEKPRYEEQKRLIDEKAAFRQRNLNPKRIDGNHVMPSPSGECITEVIKKLKMINDEEKEKLIAELKSVNLSKYIGEVVFCICEADFCSTDIQAVVEICSYLHQTYMDFTACLIPELLKVIFPGKSKDSDSEKVPQAMKKENTLKLIIELFLVGIVEDASIFITIIKDLTSPEHLKDADTTQTNLSLLASFACQGKVFLQEKEHGKDDCDEFFISLNISSDHKKFFKEALYSFYDLATKHLFSAHESLCAVESEHDKILYASGESSGEATASYEKIKKSFDELLHGVSCFAKAIDVRPPVLPQKTHDARVTNKADENLTQKVDRDIPFDVIRDKIYPFMPACDVLSARLVTKNWNSAYCDGLNPPQSQNPPQTLGQIQPACGGRIPVGFLLATDSLQKCATVGMKTRQRSRGLEDEFPGRDPRIIASCCGFYCVYLSCPEDMLVWNPAVGQQRTIFPSVSREESHYTGLAVSFQDGVQVANRYWVVVPYLPTFINADSPNPRIRFRVWTSDVQAWEINATIIDLEEFKPNNVVRVDEIVYFHISRHEVVFYNLGEGQPGMLNVPVQVVGAVDFALCERQGSLGIISYDIVENNIRIHTLEGPEWMIKVTVAMTEIVARHRVQFRSLSQDLRSRESEDALAALLDIGLVGYADPRWLLISQRDGWILIDVIDRKARRLRLKERGRILHPGVERVFFVSHKSTFLRLV